MVGADDDRLINRYLLGELSEDEQSRVEERLFADSLFFWKIESACNELIDDYLRGTLAGHERQRFETYFITSPSRRQRVESVRMLNQAIDNINATAADQTTQRSQSLGHFPKIKLLLAAALVIAAAGAWLVTETIRLRHRLEQVETERRTLEQREETLRQQTETERATREQIASQLQREQDERARLEQQLAAIRETQRFAQAAPLIASLTLVPISVRDPTRMTKLVIGARTGRVRLRVNFDGQAYASYRAILQTVEGAQIWQKAGLKASGKTILLDIPASLLAEADYLLTLIGVPAQGQSEEVGKYSFRVVKR